MNEFSRGTGVEEEDILLGRKKQARIANCESDYQKRRLNRGPLTPTRADPFAANRQAGAEDEGQGYREIMAARDIEREEARVLKTKEEKREKGEVDGNTHHEAALKREDSSDKENKDALTTISLQRFPLLHTRQSDLENLYPTHCKPHRSHVAGSHHLTSLFQEYRQGDRSPGRPRDTAQQSKGAGTSTARSLFLTKVLSLFEPCLQKQKSVLEDTICKVAAACYPTKGTKPFLIRHL
ncbi:MAG: hypothetical protein Q9190_000298 [Brigantiaea leucoxantha]